MSSGEWDRMTIVASRRRAAPKLLSETLRCMFSPWRRFRRVPDHVRRVVALRCHRGPAWSISVLALQHHRDGANQDREVERKAPVLDIPEIQFGARLDFSTVSVAPLAPWTWAHPVMPALT